MSRILQSVRNLARKTPKNLIKHVHYCTTSSKTHLNLSILRRLYLNNDDSNLVGCVFNGDLHHARQMVDEMPQRGNESQVVTFTSLITKLAQEGLVDEARVLFDILPDRNVFTCNAMLGGYVQCERMVEACEFFEEMTEKNVVSWSSMVCGLMRVGRIEEANALFEEMPFRNEVSWNTLAGGLVRNGDLEGARSVFFAMLVRDLVSWNTMIGGYVDSHIMEEAKALFDRMEERNLVNWTTLIGGYCKEGDVWSAYDLFRRIPVKNDVSWTAMIDGFCSKGYYEEAISLFLEMRGHSDVEPNFETLFALTCACGGVGFRGLSTQLHAHLITNSSAYHDHNERLSHGLICMYARCGLMEYAESVFLNNSAVQPTECWNDMINGYAHNGQMEKAKHVFNAMPERDVISWTSLITGYFDVNQVSEACKLFNNMPATMRDAVAWTAMISGCVKNALFSEAMSLFSEMQMEGLMPLRETYATLLKAADINIGRQLHSLLTKTHTDLDLILGNSLISMYAKNGNTDGAFRIFSNMTCKDLNSWNSMIMGYAHHKQANEALSLFDDMIKSKTRPNSATFHAVLSACNHTGSLDEGLLKYRVMTEVYGITPDAEHHICMVNLLGQAGEVEEAEQFVLNSPFKQDTTVLGALLGVCGNVNRYADIAKRTVQRLLELDPANALNTGASVLRYGDEGMLRKAERVMNDNFTNNIPLF